MPRASSRTATITALAVLVLAPALLLSRSLFTPRVMLPADMLLLMEPWRSEARGLVPGFQRPQNPMLDPIQQQLPWRTHAARELRQGTVPLWNPYMFSGTAFVANLQSSIYYPPNLLFCVLPVPQAFEWVAYLHLVMAGLFAFGLARALGLGVWPSCAAGLGFGLSGFMVVWLCYVTPVAALTWMPAALWCTERLARRRRVLDAVLLAGAVAMAFLAGHGQISLYVVLTTLAYGLYRAGSLLRSDGWIEASQMVCLVAGGLLAGTSLAAAQLLPTLEFGRINYRTGAIPYESLIGIKPAQLMTLLVPDAFGNPADYTDEVGRQMGLGVNHFIEGCAYPSCVLTVLALVGLAASRRPDRWFLAGATAVAALLAIGSPVNRLTYHLVPGMNQMPNLGRALCVACLAIPILGAMGLEALLSEADPASRRTSRRALLAALALVAVVGLRCLLPILMDSEAAGFPRSVLTAIGGDLAVRQVVGRIIACTVLAAAILGLVAGRLAGRVPPRALVATGVALVAVDMLAFGQRFEPACDPAITDARLPALEALHADSPQRIAALGPVARTGSGEDTLARLSPNVGMTYGLAEIRGSESLYAKRYDEVLRRLALAPPYDALSDGRARLLDVLGVRHLVAREAFPGTEPVEGTSLVHRRPSALPPAFVVPRARPVKDQATALACFDDPAFDPRAEVPIEGGAAEDPEPGGDYEPAAIQARTNSVRSRAGGPGWLVVSQAAFPGWRAYLDGRPSPLYVAYGAVWATPVRSEGDTVDLVFLPGTSVVGQFVSLAALAGLLAVLVAALARRGSGGRSDA